MPLDTKFKPVDPALFQLLVEQSRDYAIFLVDREGIITSWNAGLRQINGYEAAEMIGRHISIFYTPEDRSKQLPIDLLRIARDSGRSEDEGWRLRKDGTRFWANVVITALHDSSGELLGYSSIARDLTHRHGQEESLRQSEERFRLLVEGVTDYAIFLLSPEGIVTSWNPGARRIKGYEEHEIIGRHFSRFYDKKDVDAAKPWIILTIAREEGRVEDEGWRLRKDGSRFWARVVVTALHDADGRLRGFAKVTQDLTRQRHADAIEEAAGKMTDFIAILAHELRNPLAAIRNAVHLQKIAPPGDAAQGLTQGIIDRQSTQLARLVDDLLDVSRITRGTFDIQLRPLDLRGIIARALETARPLIDEGHHTVEVDLPDQPVPIQGDETRLTQALTNVLNNAARYSSPRGRIQVAAFAQDQGATRVAGVSVRDTGHGIEPLLLDSIFGMFVQGREAVHRGGTGMGIGLALTRTIVELHHGTIEASSAGPGKGSEFVIRLPLDVSAGAGTATIPPAAALKREPRKHRILVVDDNVDAADVLARLLQSHGHEAWIVYEGAKAIEAFEAHRPDVVLLDIGMPEMDGLSVAREIRKLAQGSERPLIVAVTGWGTPEDRARSRQAGIDAHLVKPVEEGDVLSVMATWEAASPASIR